jgi:hypothetical protein
MASRLPPRFLQLWLWGGFGSAHDGDADGDFLDDLQVSSLYNVAYHYVFIFVVILFSLVFTSPQFRLCACFSFFVPP